MLYELAYKTCIISTYVYKYLVVLPYIVLLFDNKLYSLSRVLLSKIQISAAMVRIPYLSLYFVSQRYIHF